MLYRVLPEDTAGKHHDMAVALTAFAPSIHASVTKLAQETGPFLQGGECHHLPRFEMKVYFPNQLSIQKVSKRTCFVHR